jgi:hypothetical protein
MFDRMELRADPEIPFTDCLETVYPNLRQRSSPTENYKGMLDLRGFGLEALLFIGCRFGATNKIVFRGAAKMTLRQMAAGAARVFDCDPYDLRLARLDPALDIPGISMEWARSHVRVARKRCLKEIGGTANNSGQTLYFGRGGDSIRLYDKRLEQMRKYERLMRKLGPESFRSFEDFSGIPPTGLPVVRIERQMRVGRIPPQLDTLGSLEQNISTFNPFAAIVIYTGGKPEPNDDDYSIRKYMEGKGFRQTILERGLANTRALLNARTGGNASRKMRQLSDFLPPDPEDFSPPNLFEMFQESIGRQLSVSAAPNETLEGQTAAIGGSGSEI